MFPRCVQDSQHLSFLPIMKMKFKRMNLRNEKYIDPELEV